MTLPLHLSFRLGGPPTAAATPLLVPAAVEPLLDDATEPVETGAAEAIFKPDPEYSNRRGYNRRFLGRIVELPTLTAGQRNAAARNRRAKQNDDPLEFEYEHFSVFMNGDRKLPFFTAVNVDGASVVTINRKTGKVTVESPEDIAPEAYEKWYDDPRIDASSVTQQELYDTEIFRKIFQRGHLVKRTDPSWGRVKAAWRGQSDTFHFTNCAPQHERFNPIRSRWAGVENWISNGSDDDDLRVTVFTGPVFRPDDPVFAEFPVPREYWKVVVRVDDGQLLATAILADQSDLLRQSEAIAAGRAAEDLPPFPDILPEEYQVTVAEIEELTGLDFGPLRDHDTFAGGSEGARGHRRRRIERFEDISIRPQSSQKTPRKRRRPTR